MDLGNLKYARVRFRGVRQDRAYIYRDGNGRIVLQGLWSRRRDLHSQESSEAYRALFDVLLEYYVDSKSPEDIHVLLADRSERYICKRCYSSLTSDLS